MLAPARLHAPDVAAAAGVGSAFIGVLESPIESDGPCLGEILEVRGWALGVEPIDRVLAAIEPIEPIELRCGLTRSDVVAAFTDRADCASSGFTGRLTLSGLAAGRHTLVVTAHAGDRIAHTWRRPVHLCATDAAYGQWRLRLERQPRIDAPARRAVRNTDAGPVATWIVWPDSTADDGAAEATASTLRREGRGHWDAVVVNPGAQRGAGPHLPPRVSTAYVGTLRAGDRLAPGAAELLLTGMRDALAPDLIYGDHDHLDDSGRCIDPVFKPDWSPMLGKHPDVVSRGWLVRRELFDDELWSQQHARAGAAPGLPSAVAARCSSVWHVARPLLSLRHPTSQGGLADEAVPAISDRTISVVIPSRLADRDLMARCLDGLRCSTRGAELEIVVALNNLRDIAEADARAFLLRWGVVAQHIEGDFNWSRLNNLAARAAQGDLLLFLNDDVEPIVPDWLGAMLLLAEDPQLGAVGAVLRYPDGGIQHAGIYINGGERPTCRHSFRHCSGLEPRVRRWLAQDRTQTAVTGACLLTPRRAFDQLGGFDEGLPVVFNDVDYCLRLREHGLLSAVAARAELRHHEGLSRGDIAEEADRRRFSARWAAWLPETDPHSHPGLIRDRDDWMFDPLWLPPAGYPTP